MRILLDTNIIIHREASKVIHPDIGLLFRWFDKTGATKIIHPLTVKELAKHKDKTIAETMKIKIRNYFQLKTLSKETAPIIEIRESDETENDYVDTSLINELYNKRVDIIITEDRGIHLKAKSLNIDKKVFTIDTYLEKVTAENPNLVDYKVLSVKKEHFGNVDLNDHFFDSFKEDYHEFEGWFNRKADEESYICQADKKIGAFLYLKVETDAEDYGDIFPVFSKKKRLKIGTFKVLSTGYKLGERFLKIIFDNALTCNVEEIYVTIFEKREDQIRLIKLLEDWGFKSYGVKKTINGEELVLVRDFICQFNIDNPKFTFPYISKNKNVFMIPIYPDYHTDLLPDSILTTESPNDFVENEPHRNAISKVYISRSIRRDIEKGDIIVFYRTATGGRAAYYTSVITTIAICEGKADDIADENDFILKCRRRSVFDDNGLKKFWNYNPRYRPFIINFLYVHSFPTGKRINRQKLLELGILTGEENEIRGLKKITKDHFEIILKETETNESYFID
ncbi:MAG: PIN domain-containing protein [Candidatus Tenebribacter burtonii]|jgi:predicted nucleic acid-binding protein|nr:PIN domain-containing protein [Candidatus Tenebribacter burtonii]